MTATRQVAGVAIVAAAIVLATHSLFELVRIGTCGAPPGAVAIRACPEGAGSTALLLVLAIFVLPFVGAAVARSVPLVIAWWCLVWIAMGSAALVAGHGPAAPPDASDADAVAITFLAIGLGSVVVLLFIGWATRRTRAGRPLRLGPIGAQAPGAADGAVDRELAELLRLRSRGLITRQEFVERRRRILGG